MNVNTSDIIAALRHCSAPGGSVCESCAFANDPWCGDVLFTEAANRLEEYVDRCARYAEEVAQLRSGSEAYGRDIDAPTKWTPVSEPPEEWRRENGEMINYLVYVPEFGVDIGNYAEPAKCWLCMGLPCKPTHWAHLPQPPKGVSGDG